MALIERLQKNIDAGNRRGEIPMNYVYTAGRALDEFFKTIRDKGEFIRAKCTNCNLVYLPPRIYCERCFSKTEEKYVNVPNKGIIHTFTVCHETYQEEHKDTPSIVALIKMENSSGGLLHWIGEVEPEKCYIGMPVQAVFKPKKDREGGILDIKYFKPST
jgi:uncharacterized OB-fold protein